MSWSGWELESQSSKNRSNSLMFVSRLASQACRYFSFIFRLGLVAKPQLELAQVVACHWQWEVLDVICTVWK